MNESFEQAEARRWEALYELLLPGMTADPSEFIAFDAESLIAEARQLAKARQNSSGPC